MSNKCLICEKKLSELQFDDKKFICKDCIEDIVERALNLDKLVDFEFKKK